MTSKMVSDRIQSMRAVQGSIDQNADAIAARIDARLRPYLRSGETMPELALVLRLMGRELEARAGAVQATEEQHARELADDAGPRSSRDRHAATVREVYTDLRGALSSAYGDDVLSRLRVREPASSVPSVLVQQGQAAREALLDASIELPAPRRRGARIDRGVFAEELSDAVLALQKALVDVERETKEADATHAAKSEALDGYDGAFARLVPAVSALYVLAEQDGLAAKLRVNKRRRGVLEDPSQPESPEEPEPPTEA